MTLHAFRTPRATQTLRARSRSWGSCNCLSVRPGKPEQHRFRCCCQAGPVPQQRRQKIQLRKQGRSLPVSHPVFSNWPWLFGATLGAHRKTLQQSSCSLRLPGGVRLAVSAMDTCVNVRLPLPIRQSRRVSVSAKANGLQSRIGAIEHVQKLACSPSFRLLPVSGDLPGAIWVRIELAEYAKTSPMLSSCKYHNRLARPAVCW